MIWFGRVCPDEARSAKSRHRPVEQTVVGKPGPSPTTVRFVGASETGAHSLLSTTKSPHEGDFLL